MSAIRKGTAKSLRKLLRERTPAELEVFRLRYGDGASARLLMDMHHTDDLVEAMVCYLQSRGDIRLVCLAEGA